jgi:hypothetical protein
MAASIYIVVEGEDPGYDIYVEGQALARQEGAVEKLARSLGVRPLLEFFSADVNSMALLIEEGGGNPDLLHRLPAAQWFRPEDGLATVDALVTALEDDTGRITYEGAAVLAELSQYRTVLRKTVAAGFRWHLAVSFR